MDVPGRWQGDESGGESGCDDGGDDGGPVRVTVARVGAKAEVASAGLVAAVMVMVAVRTAVVGVVARAAVAMAGVVRVTV